MNDTHHHGPLAGVGAGAAAVLFAFGVLALAWHRVAGRVSLGVTVLVYVLITAMCALLIAAMFYAVIWLRHRVRNPHLLAGRRTVQAEIVAAQPAGSDALPYMRPAAAIEAPRVYLNVTQAQLAAIMRHNGEGS